MEDSLQLRFLDLIIKPKTCYCYERLTIDGYKIISTKDEQRAAGFIVKRTGIVTKPEKSFGPSVIKPYRDYYGKFILKTSLLSEEIQVLFAIGYIFNNKVVTIDDMSNFGWLRLCTPMDDIIYPNLCHHQQLLHYLIQHSSKPRFMVTRIYHYLQFDLYQELQGRILELNSQ